MPQSRGACANLGAHVSRSAILIEGHATLTCVCQPWALCLIFAIVGVAVFLLSNRDGFGRKLIALMFDEPLSSKTSQR